MEQRLQLIGGVFAYWDQAQSSTTISLMPARLGFVPLGSITEDLVSIDNRDWALYGQATGELTTWASLTAGARYTQERKELSRVLRIPQALLNNPQACRPGACPETFANFSDHATYSAWTPMASLALEAPESWLQAGGSLNHVMPYFTYARGFSGGGFNGGSRSDNPLERAGFKPEYAHSYEWGLKTVAFDERIAINFAYFIMDRIDMQVPAQITESCPADVPDCIPEVRALTTNAAKGRTQGFELETMASPIRGMHLSGSVGYTDARYVDFPNSQDEISGEIRDRSGERLPFVPEWTTHVSVEQSFDVPALGPAWLRGSLTPRLDWSYVSATVHFAPEIRELTQPGYNIVNLRIPYDFNEDRSEIAFWATNLTDEVYFANSVSFARLTGAGIRYYEPPRAFGVEITQRFF